MKHLIKTVLIVFMLFNFSCINNTPKPIKTIKNYFLKTHNVKIDNSINKIVIITEGSICGQCDRLFSELVLKNLLNDSTIILVNAKGTIINIKDFLDLKKNCYFDWQLDTTKFPEFKTSRVIYLKDNDIDTIIIINPRIILKQIEYIKTR